MWLAPALILRSRAERAAPRRMAARTIARLRGRRLRRDEQQLVDAVAVHVDDLDPPAVDLEVLAFLRDARHPLEREPGGGVKVAVRLDAQSRASP